MQGNQSQSSDTMRYSVRAGESIVKNIGIYFSSLTYRNFQVFLEISIWKEALDNITKNPLNRNTNIWHSVIKNSIPWTLLCSSWNTHWFLSGLQLIFKVPSMKPQQLSTTTPLLWTTFAKLIRFSDERKVCFNEKKRWLTLHEKKNKNWLNMSDWSDADLHLFANHQSKMHSALTDKQHGNLMFLWYLEVQTRDRNEWHPEF